MYTEVSEIFILVPALLGLKGNLEMTLASRLSTQVSQSLSLYSIGYSIQSNLYKSATFGSELKWLLYTGGCLIKVQSEQLSCRKYSYCHNKILSKEGLPVCVS